MIQQPNRLDEYADNGLVAEIVKHEDAPDECIIFLRPCDPDDQVTGWLSAQEQSFVALDEMR